MRVVGLLLLASRAAAVNVYSHGSPDAVAAEVARETRENIQIHEGFLSQEQKDVKTEQSVKADKDLSALQKSAVPVKDPCGGITCGALSCPAGFNKDEVPGHCCPYCVNPNIKLETVTGAVGSNGGKPSAICKEVWCFPTMCANPVTAATTTNGQCCDTCA